MENDKLLLLNDFVNRAYDCHTFPDFLKLAILRLNDLVSFDSGMFFCAISRDCSYFKPYAQGNAEEAVCKRKFNERENYRNLACAERLGKEAYVYRAEDYAHGIIQVDNEPRDSFISDQSSFFIVCVRILYKNEFLGEIYLHRSREKPDFSDEDMFVLRLLQPHIATVFNIIHSMTAVRLVENFEMSGAQIGLSLFDREMSLVGGNISGIETLKMSTDLGSSVLYHVKGQCQEMLEESAENGKNPAAPRTFLLKIQHSDLKIEIIPNRIRERGSGGRFLVTMEFMSDSQTLSDYRYKFSKREAEVIDGLIQGKSNVSLANSFSLSENTIKTHIKNIYKKTGANNRTELVYILMLNK